MTRYRAPIAYALFAAVDATPHALPQIPRVVGALVEGIWQCFARFSRELLGPFEERREGRLGQWRLAREMVRREGDEPT